jgi:signal transduction histidine kinase
VSERRINPFRWQLLKRLPAFFDLRLPDPSKQVARIRMMERNVGLPIKGAIIIVLLYHLFFSNWFDAVSSSTRGKFTAVEAIREFFLAYIFICAGAAIIFFKLNDFSLRVLQHVVFAVSVIDALFLGVLTFVTDGFDSFLYWVFIALIVRNTISMPLAGRQIGLNLIATGCYVAAGIIYGYLSRWEYAMAEDIIRPALDPPTNPTEGALLRVCLLILMTICCYGVQVLLEKQKRAEDEAREFTLRQEQLQATGRLAAEIAHQLKNPLGIINNAAFTLQRTMKEGKTITQQIRIIREEVERSDRIITELMGYARLSEGQVEKLNVAEELDSAIERVFPAGAKYDVTISREYTAALPTLLLQRAHLSEVFVNILQNAREAMDGKGHVDVTTAYGDNYSVIVTIQDNGPGIPSDKLPKVFEPYYTTKEKGTGLGLAIVKHNTEIYNGTVRVESEIGKGTKFIVTLPAKTVFNLKR